MQREPRRAPKSLSIERRRGGARGPLVAVLAGVLLLVGTLVFLALRSEPGVAGAPGAERARGERGTPTALSPAGPAGGAQGATGDGGARQGASNALSEPPTAAATRGTLRGELVLQGGARAPERWTLVVEASPSLTTPERAEGRRLEFDGSQRTFHLDDLPLAGYRLRAEAAGLNGRPAEVLLVPTSSNVFVTLALAPAGFVDGFVLNADGSAADGVLVTLEHAATGDYEQRPTDANGAYRFDAVIDGEYALIVGPRPAPLLAPQALSMRAPSLRAPEQRLPPLGTLSLVVAEVGGALVPGARVLGSNSAGGAFEAQSDDAGRVLARHLIPGTWRIEALYEERSSGGATLELTAGATLEAQLTLRN